MPKSSLQIQIETLLLKYINRFVRYAQFAHIPQDHQELLLGTFSYLIDEQDVVPDDVPNIGFLDDLIIFLEAADALLQSRNGQDIAGVVNANELAQDRQLISKYEPLLYGAHKPSIESLKKRGTKDPVDLKTVADTIKQKYAGLGRAEE